MFAKRILSLSANSASCERLFSIFGNILTKVRNRSGDHDAVLVGLSEVKMHVRDEHIASGIKTRIKRQFSAKSSSATTAQSQSGPSSSSASVSVNSIINGVLRVHSFFVFNLT
jgi:hypothetical protein